MMNPDIYFTAEALRTLHATMFRSPNASFIVSPWYGSRLLSHKRAFHTDLIFFRPTRLGGVNVWEGACVPHSTKHTEDLYYRMVKANNLTVTRLVRGVKHTFRHPDVLGFWHNRAAEHVYAASNRDPCRTRDRTGARLATLT